MAVNVIQQTSNIHWRSGPDSRVLMWCIARQSYVVQHFTSMSLMSPSLASKPAQASTEINKTNCSYTSSFQIDNKSAAAKMP
jgi:hypothetical protein